MKLGLGVGAVFIKKLALLSCSPGAGAEAELALGRALGDEVPQVFLTKLLRKQLVIILLV